VLSGLTIYSGSLLKHAKHQASYPFLDWVFNGLILTGRKWFGRAVWVWLRTKSCCAITVTGEYGCWRRIRYLPKSRRIRRVEMIKSSATAQERPRYSH